MQTKGLKRILVTALCAFAAGIPAPVEALVFTDNFNDNQIDPTWWTTGTAGTSTIEAVNGRIEMVQGDSADSYAAISLKPWITGDFTVTIDYTLLYWPMPQEWPNDNKARLQLNAYASDSNQLAMERISDRLYSPFSHDSGELYVTHFTGQGVIPVPTDHMSGTMRLVRSGDVVQGSFWDGLNWQLVDNPYSVAGENSLARLIGIGLGSVAPVTPGVRVAIDNFSLNAPSVPAIPEPETYSMLLAGLAMLGYIARKRRQP